MCKLRSHEARVCLEIRYGFSLYKAALNSKHPLVQPPRGIPRSWVHALAPAALHSAPQSSIQNSGFSLLKRHAHAHNICHFVCSRTGTGHWGAPTAHSRARLSALSRPPGARPWLVSSCAHPPAVFVSVCAATRGLMWRQQLTCSTRTRPSRPSRRAGCASCSPGTRRNRRQDHLRRTGTTCTSQYAG